MKLAGGWNRKSTKSHNNNSETGVAMVQYGGPGRGYQGGRGHIRGQGRINGQGGGTGRSRGGGERGAHNQSQQ